MSGYLLTASILRGIDQVVQAKGADFSVIERSTGIERQWLAQQEVFLPGALGTAVLRASVELTGDPSLPIQLIERQDTSIFGDVGLLFETAQTLQQGIDAFLSFHQLHNPYLTWSIEQEKQEFRLCPQFHRIDPLQSRLVVDMALGHSWMICRHCSPTLRLLRVELSRERDQYDARYRNFYQAPVRYQAQEDRLVFRLSDLDKPLARSNQRIFTVLRTSLSNDMAQPLATPQSNLQSGQLRQQVERLVRSLLQAGCCSIEKLAALYTCDKRTLQRYLKEEGISYQQVLDAVRDEMAQHYLRRPETTITQVALLLGFTDASNFARAFGKRFKMSPSAWRRREGVERTSSFGRRQARIDKLLLERSHV